MKKAYDEYRDNQKILEMNKKTGAASELKANFNQSSLISKILPNVWKYSNL